MLAPFPPHRTTTMAALWLWLSIVVVTLGCDEVQGFGSPSMVLKLPAKCPVVICPGFGNDARDCELLSYLLRTDLPGVTTADSRNGPGYKYSSNTIHASKYLCMYHNLDLHNACTTSAI